MEKLKNILFIDDNSIIEMFKYSDDGKFQFTDFDGLDLAVWQRKTDDPIQEFSTALRENATTVKNYVILTRTPTLFHDQFIPNNIVETSKPKPFKSILAETKWIFEKFGRERVSSPNRIFLTSDQHFGHRNIIKYCSRPWNSGRDENGNMLITDQDVERMDETMIEKWNSVVGRDDIVYNLGDVIFGDKTRLPNLVSRLNGRKRLILGNHDNAPKHLDVIKYFMDAGFERVYDRNIIINDFVILSHFPVQFLPPDSVFFNCYGHVHNSELFQTWTKNSCCVCVERHDYVPVSLDTIKAKYEEMNR